MTFFEQIELAVQFEEPKRTEQFNKIDKRLKSDEKKNILQKVRQRIDDAFIELPGFSQYELRDYQTMFAREFFHVLHLEHYQQYIDEKTVDLKLHISRLELRTQHSTSDNPEELDDITGQLFLYRRFTAYLEAIASKRTNSITKDIEFPLPKTAASAEVRPSIAQIAMICYYNGIEVTRSTASGIVVDHGWTSGDSLYNEHNRFINIIRRDVETWDEKDVKWVHSNLKVIHAMVKEAKLNHCQSDFTKVKRRLAML